MHTTHNTITERLATGQADSQPRALLNLLFHFRFHFDLLREPHAQRQKILSTLNTFCNTIPDRIRKVFCNAFRKCFWSKDLGVLDCLKSSETIRSMTQNTELRQAVKHLESALSVLKKLLQITNAAADNALHDANSKELCLECKNPLRPIHRRGLCNGCYHAAMNAIKDKAFTDDQLFAAGRIGPRQKPGRKPTRDYSNLPSPLDAATVQVEKTECPESSAAAKRLRGKK
jgi:hypothetical protein